MSPASRALAVVAGLAALAVSQAAAARTVELPAGGRAVPVVRDGVVCGPLPAGWTLLGDRRSVRPPPAGVGLRAIDVRVAADADACERSRPTLTLLATGPHPGLDPGGVVFFPDDGRLELRGQRLQGLQVLWELPEARAAERPSRPREGKDACLEPTPLAGGRLQHCVVALPPGLPADTVLRWLPANGLLGEDTQLYDESGNPVAPADLVLRPARLLISRLVPAAATVDVSQGPARVPLVHPAAVSAVDCGAVRCELADGAILVRTVPATATGVTMRLRLAPRAFYLRGEAQETQATLTLPLVQCPLALVSGPPLRGAEESRLVVRVDPRCVKESGRARWSVNGEAADELRSVRVNDATFVVLRVGRLLADRAVITAQRADLDGTLIGSLAAATVEAPRPRVTLELPAHGKVEFVPTNRNAVITVGGARAPGRFVPLPVDGAYTVRSEGAHRLLRGDENAGGFVSLRFGYRVDGLPPELGELDLAVLSDRVQRAVREASVPAPFGPSADSPEPLVELLCAAPDGRPYRVLPGRLHILRFDAKDTCRVVLHRERLQREYGLQEVTLEVEVTKADGGRRPEVSFSERMTLVPGAEARVLPLRGGAEQFDRLLVRLSQVLDETRYAPSPGGPKELPAVQWPLAIEGGRLRLYATATIPAGLYRLNKPTGQLTLNFGVLSRLTWLDKRGREGLLGAEIGLMGMGLIQRPGAIDYPPTIGALLGLGIRVPLGGSAAVGVHVWAVYELRDEFRYKVDPNAAGGCAADAAGVFPAGCKAASRLAFIFGPSISIGDVGTNL